MKILAFAALFSLNALALDFKSPGTYTVPTTNLSLLPYSQFEVPQVRVKLDQGKVEMTYNFPKGLTGSDVKVELEGQVLANGDWVLYGYVGSLKCKLVDGFRSCMAEYKGIDIKKEEVESHLRSISTTEEEFQARLEVASIFDGGGENSDSQPIKLLRFGMDGERIGVLRFKAE